MSEQSTSGRAPGYGVVVGDDGSARAFDAVRFAVEEARRRQTTLDVVRAWTIRTAVRPPDIGPGEVPSTAEFEQATREFTERRIAKLIGDDGPPVRVHVPHGSSSKELIAMSQQAELLVVGDRGIGGLAGRLLGSTADAVIRGAKSPVTVVRPKAG